MRSAKTVWIISFVLSFSCIGSIPFVRAQSAYTPIQFGHVHKPYGSDSDQQPYSTSPTSPNSSSSASSPSVTPSTKQLAQRANGGWIQRHYIVGTEGGGIIGRHGPQWHVGGQN